MNILYLIIALIILLLFLLKSIELFEEILEINNTYLEIVANNVKSLSYEELDSYHIVEADTNNQLQIFKNTKNINDLFGMSFKDVIRDISLGGYDIDEPILNTNNIPLIYNNEFRNYLICSYLDAGYYSKGTIPPINEQMDIIRNIYDIDCSGVTLSNINGDKTTTSLQNIITSTSTTTTTPITSTSTSTTSTTTTTPITSTSTSTTTTTPTTSTTRPITTTSSTTTIPIINKTLPVLSNDNANNSSNNELSKLPNDIANNMLFCTIL